MMKLTHFIGLCVLLFGLQNAKGQSTEKSVSPVKMEEIYQEVKTPYKYGLVLASADPSLKTDCPSVFRKDSLWYMTYLEFGGRGYETCLAQSEDLLHWKKLGTIMSFSDSNLWDAEQKAGYTALYDTEWNGEYQWQSYEDKHWMTYFGGNTQGYEAGTLSIGVAYTQKNPARPHEWQRLTEPILTPNDQQARWWENSTMYKNSVIQDKEKLTGHPFVMYYNARGDSLNPDRGAERIGMAVSDDMVHWERFLKDPVINHHTGISGDAYLQKINDLWVMFYFGAFWKEGAFNRFAASYDLVHWTDWEGDDLIASSEPYDEMFAHKSFVIKHNGVVYHFYCAVNNQEERGIAVATSKDLGNSTLSFQSKNTQEKPGK